MKNDFGYILITVIHAIGMVSGYLVRDEIDAVLVYFFGVFKSSAPLLC